MEECINLDGSFLSSVDENTSGYSIEVTGAELLSHDEYIQKYGLDESKINGSLDTKSLVCLEITVHNDDNSDGGIFLFSCDLVPERKNTYYIPDTWLWAESEQQVSDGSTRYLKIAPNSTYTVHVPYKNNIYDEENLTEYKTPITDTSFDLILSNSPVRKIVHIDL